MTERREFNAETVEAAVEEAAASLRVSPEGLVYEVLDTGSPGFLGIGTRDARIAVNSERAASAEAGGAERPEERRDAVEHRDEVEQVSEKETEASHSEAPEELLEEIRSFVTSAVEGIGLENPSIEVYDAGELIAVDIASSETGLFIGQKGETIDALQYLLNTSVYKRRPFVKRIVLDSEGYRQRRVEAVQGMAHRSARRAVREKQTVELPPMNPAERRIVHLFLKENSQVSTMSQGHGDERRVAISPNRE